VWGKIVDFRKLRVLKELQKKYGYDKAIAKWKPEDLKEELSTLSLLDLGEKISQEINEYAKLNNHDPGDLALVTMLLGFLVKQILVDLDKSDPGLSPLLRIQFLDLLTGDNDGPED
jgi:hypothetical protein